jgi:hypothetical protein
MSKILEIEKIKQLLDSGALTPDQYQLLLKNIIGEEATAVPPPGEPTAPDVGLPPPIPASTVKTINIAETIAKYSAPVPKRVKILNGFDLELRQSIIENWPLNSNKPYADVFGKLEAADLLLYYDDSLWRNSKSGLIITAKGFVSKCYGEEEVQYWPMDDIQKIHKVTSGSELMVWIDSIDVGESIGICSVSGDQNVCEYLNGLLLTLD